MSVRTMIKTRDGAFVKLYHLEINHALQYIDYSQSLIITS